MRFVAAYNLKPGQQLARDLRIDKNRVLLRGGVELTDTQIAKISAMGFQGAYIEDAISKGIRPRQYLSDDLYMSLLTEVRAVFDTVERNGTNRQPDCVLSLEPLSREMIQALPETGAMISDIGIRAYDDYIYHHCVNVAALSLLLGNALGIGRRKLQELAISALVHDIGRVFLDKRIINKQSKLTAEEFEEIKRHTLSGYNYFRNCFDLSDSGRAVILSHHEHYCGTGYPAGGSGNDIPLLARIVAVADVYDALVSARAYRYAMLPHDAVDYIMSGYNTLFDPTVVDAFVRCVAPYPEGTCVRLSNDALGIVAENYSSACRRPRIELIENGARIGRSINLSRDYTARDVKIVAVEEIINS